MPIYSICCVHTECKSGPLFGTSTHKPAIVQGLGGWVALHVIKPLTPSPPLNFDCYADRATCHQKAAATAANRESSGTIHAHPSETPVQLAPAKAASNPSGLRMACDRSPDQLQFKPST